MVVWEMRAIDETTPTELNGNENFIIENISIESTNEGGTAEWLSRPSHFAAAV